MPEITREQLGSYLDNSLSDTDSAQVEQALLHEIPPDLKFPDIPRSL